MFSHLPKGGRARSPLIDIPSVQLPPCPTYYTSKYIAIKKILYNLWIDQIEGDCIEFGIFTGSSFKHTIKTENRVNKKNKTRFFGLDSFEGFPDNDHPFFQDINFKSYVHSDADLCPTCLEHCEVIEERVDYDCSEAVHFESSLDFYGAG